MALPADDQTLTNVYLPAGPGGNTLERESLRDVVERVYKTEAPLYNNTMKTEADALKMEWGEEDLGAITAAEPRKHGFVAAPTAAVSPVRLDNYLQLIAEEGSVSRTMAALRAAGGTNTLAHQRLKKGELMLRRINKRLYTGQVKDGTVTATKLATIHAYILPANFRSEATTPGTLGGSSNGATLPTAGTTPQAFDSIVPIDAILQSAFLSRGKPSVLYMSPKNSAAFSRLPDASIAENRIVRNAGNAGPFVHVGVVDQYMSDFGVVEKAVDIDCPNTDILLIDHDYIDMPIVPGMDFDETELGIRASSREFMIEWLGTLRVTMRSAHGLVNGLT
jgi:hypothetical protein